YVICFSLDLPLVKIQIWLLQGWLGWVSGATRPLMRLVTLSNMPILQQLHLEEELLRRTSDNWCVINDGMAPATILTGMSGTALESRSLSTYSRSSGTKCRLFMAKILTDLVNFICVRMTMHLVTRKFGGNAQSITKNRWLHHMSFLWDYDVKNMDYLKIPKRAPEYRLSTFAPYWCELSIIVVTQVQELFEVG
ncbi:hypothetical protein Zm00014a_034362, partial [Zea mays]